MTSLDLFLFLYAEAKSAAEITIATAMMAEPRACFM
jgi:hypothetical protein